MSSVLSKCSLQRTPYFDGLFNDFGIWQHTDGKKPIVGEGFALDDATRGLLLCLALGKKDKANILFDYILKSRINGEFFGFADANHKFIKAPASEDMVGQIVWAFGYAASVGFRQKEALDFIEEITPDLLKMKSLRGPIYTLLGAIYIDKDFEKKIHDNLIRKLDNLEKTWLWPEEIITYGNGLLPYALLRYALFFNDKKTEMIGRDILEFLEEVCTNNRTRGPIGNDGWYKRYDDLPPTYSQQPIDAAYMAWAWLAAYQVSKQESDIENVKLWISWFEGKNIANCPMYDKENLKAFDGIDNLAKNPQHCNEFGINQHSGAETNICFLLSLWMLQEQKTI